MLRPFVPGIRLSLPLVAVAVLALTGGAMIGYATRVAPWAGSDSVEYVEAARNLAAGRGLVLVRASGTSVPMYLHPPLYSIVLATLMVVGFDAVEAGRIVAIASFSGLLLMPGLLALVIKDKYALPLALAAYLLASPTVVANSTGLMSESLFLLLLFLAVSLAVVSMSGGRRALLPVAAALAGLAMLTRFAGVACVLVVAVVPFLERRRRFGPTMAASLGLALTGVLPTVLWASYVRAGGYAPGGVYSLPEGNLWAALEPVRAAYTDLIWGWLPLRLLMPISAYRPRATLLLALSAILACLVGWPALRTNRCAAKPKAHAFVSVAALLLVLFAALHAFVVAAGFLVVGLPKSALERILVPSQVTFVTGVVLALYALLMHLRNSLARLALPLLLIVPLVWSGWPSTWHYVRQLHEEGWGYTNRSWQQSPIVDALRALSPSLSIVSNDIDAVTFYGERPAFPIPELQAGRSTSAWAPFGEDPQSEAESLFAEGRAALVLFSQGRYQFSQLYGDRAPERLRLLVEGLRVVYEGPDGGIYLSQEP